MYKKIFLVVSILGVLLLVAGCKSDTKDYSNMTTKEIIADLTNNSYDFSASATDQELIITQNGEKTVYKMPTNEFYISFAPYINNTHTWTIHSVTGCNSELKNEEMQVKITSKTTNITLVNEKLKTNSRGFIDVWLPRSDEYTFEVTYKTYSLNQTITTYKGDPTCLTTPMKLT